MPGYRTTRETEISDGDRIFSAAAGWAGEVAPRGTVERLFTAGRRYLTTP